MKTHLHKQSGSVVLILTIVLTVLILGGLGYVAYTKFFVPEDDVLVKTTQEQPVAEQVVSQLPDDVIYNPAISIKADSDINQLENAPDSFKKYIISEIEKDNLEIKEDTPNCERIFTVSSIYKQVYARGTTGGFGDCVGGAAILWALSEGEWLVVGGTQNVGFACEELEQYKVPSAIAGTTCVTTDPGYPEGKPYSQN